MFITALHDRRIDAETYPTRKSLAAVQVIVYVHSAGIVIVWTLNGAPRHFYAIAMATVPFQALDEVKAEVNANVSMALLLQPLMWLIKYDVKRVPIDT